MGIFDKLLRAIGFEDGGEIEKQKKSSEKTKKEKKVSVSSKFNLKDIENQNLINEKFYTPKTQEDIELIAYDLSKGNNVKVNFVEFTEEDKVRALDFLSGVIYVLNGNIEKQDEKEYLLKINR